MKSRDAAVTELVDKVAGSVLEIIARRDATGGELSQMIRRMYGQIRNAASDLYDELNPPANGRPAQPVTQKVQK